MSPDGFVEILIFTVFHEYIKHIFGKYLTEFYLFVREQSIYIYFHH